ncbi:MAG: nucleotidyltransferase domain-containing protein [Caldisericum sp.]|uniref:nucleotidyltransferase domain-containing protein n=1 Tax=Caldisericum sp. TaxID=2499687 RepID=UPI003D11DCB9
MKDEIKKVEEFLSSKDFIVFALLFGSFARGLANDISDVDIGIYVERDISILEYGNFVSQLQSLTGKRRDLIILNNSYEKKPALCLPNNITRQGLFYKK